MFKSICLSPSLTVVLAPTVHSGVSPAVAMAALMDIEEEGMREDLVDPATTEEERAQLRERLA